MGEGDRRAHIYEVKLVDGARRALDVAWGPVDRADPYGAQQVVPGEPLAPGMPYSLKVLWADGDGALTWQFVRFATNGPSPGTRFEVGRRSLLVHSDSPAPVIVELADPASGRLLLSTQLYGADRVPLPAGLRTFELCWDQSATRRYGATDGCRRVTRARSAARPRATPGSRRPGPSRA